MSTILKPHYFQTPPPIKGRMTILFAIYLSVAKNFKNLSDVSLAKTFFGFGSTLTLTTKL